MKAIDPRANWWEKTEDRKPKIIYLSNLDRIIHTNYILDSF